MTENSFLCEFHAQVSQIVLLADLTVLRAYYYGMSQNVRRLISPRVLCTSITTRVLSWFDRFTDYYYCMNKNFHKTHISTTFVHKYPKSCS